ncbi:immunoglobulin superfamily DCC subclass member 4-like [Mya arenaria]|uniref:immunoglobulin superfamily DCC subclass member 4-like n=1 Tax=Mya arenaria TaxID=6604 RepID=UPI0022E68C95|nr:immunoglobulin superfamily DCC subclass member 4-like [Mya arenaria]
MMMIFFLGLVVLAFTDVRGLTVTQAPVNTAVLEGRNATIACTVTGKAATESVQWKFKANGTTTFNPVTFDNNILGSTSKYAIHNPYSLTIINAATSDYGVYRCTAGSTDYDATLTVASKFDFTFIPKLNSSINYLPTAVNIVWSGQPHAGSTVNLTCTATNGRPTPDLRWVINGMEQTSSAVLETNSVTANGYGNSVSNLPLALTTEMDGHQAICYVAYDGWNDAMNATLTLDVNGGVSMRMRLSGIALAVIVAISVVV